MNKHEIATALGEAKTIAEYLAAGIPADDGSDQYKDATVRIVQDVDCLGRWSRWLEELANNEDASN